MEASGPTGSISSIGRLVRSRPARHCRGGLLCFWAQGLPSSRGRRPGIRGWPPKPSPPERTWAKRDATVAKPLQQPQLRRPVCQRAAPSLEVGMPGSYLGFGGGNLRAATSDSRSLLPALLRYLVEAASIAIESRFFSREALPACHDDVDVLGVDLQAIADARSGFCRGQCCSASEERIVYHLSALRVIQDRPPHQLDGLLSRMIEFFLVRTAHDELWRGRIPDGRVLARFSKPRCVFLPNVPAGLMLKPVVGSGKHRALFVPNDLLMMQEADPKQPIEDLPRELAGVPHVRNLEAWQIGRAS